MIDLKKIRTFPLATILAGGASYPKTIYNVGKRTPKQVSEILETELQFLSSTIVGFKCTDIVKTSPNNDGSLTFYIKYNSDVNTQANGQSAKH